MKPTLVFSVCTTIALLLVACGPSPRANRPTAILTNTSVLDSLLTNGDIGARIQSAQQDLPSDRWRDGSALRPGRYNLTRSDREWSVAEEALAPLAAGLTNLSAVSLLTALNGTPYGMDLASHTGVAELVYREGNKRIIAELRTRSRAELETLRGFTNDLTWVYTGGDGPPLGIGLLLTFDLLRTNGEPR